MYSSLRHRVQEGGEFIRGFVEIDVGITLAVNALLEVEVFERDNLPLDNLSDDHRLFPFGRKNRERATVKI